jgi:AraC-like DNA-binding protein
MHSFPDISLNLFSVFIFLGITQAIILAVFFLSGKNRQSPFNFYLGLFLLAITAVILEIFLMYSGYIRYVLHLVDFSESIALLLGPLFYFMIKSLVDDRKPKYVHLHLLIFYFYSMYLLFFLLQPAEVKYNAWINAYHPGYERMAVETAFSENPLGIRQFISGFTALHIGFYALLCGWETIKTFLRHKESIFKPNHPSLKILQNGLITFIIISIIIFIAEIFFVNSTGEHLIAAFASLSIYVLSFSVISNSVFFKHSIQTQPNKYKSSSLSEKDVSLLAQRIKEIMESDHPYLNENFSLARLSQQLKTSIHTTSQVINEGLGMNFYELLAVYRIRHAQKLLKDPDSSNLKIEEIAWQSGYNSKSSFNTVFKKITGMTPSQYRSQSV